MSKKIILKGSYKKDKELKNYDILKSSISCLKAKCSQPKKNMVFLQNQITLSKNENNTFYIYHMYDSYKDKYSGRWYNGAFDLAKSLNHKNKSLTTKMTFEDENTFRQYGVKIIIYFNENGWSKLIKLLSL